MKKIKLYTILMVSVLLTACGTDKKIEKQANNIVDAVENNDISELDFIINGTDEPHPSIVAASSNSSGIFFMNP